MDDLISRQAAIDAITNCTNCGTPDELRKYVDKHSLENGWTGGVLDAMEAVEDISAADVAPVVRCKECIHNNDCDIQYSAQAGENFFCGFGETEKDVREDVYE